MVNKYVKRPWLSINKKNRGNPDAEFYNSTTWRKARRIYLNEHPFCAICLQKGVYKKATVVDHIIPIRKGGERLNPENFQSLCHSCHARKSAKDK
jgi:5-methylcytosine-specific restriction endonuclease McrA